LIIARALFESNCANYELLDCDPIRQGGWQCSSGMIGLDAPAGLNTGKPTPQRINNAASTPAESSAGNATAASPPTPAVAATATASSTAQTGNSGNCYAVATGLEQSKIAFAQQCQNYKRNDCDPLGNNRWVCSSANVSNAQPDADAETEARVEVEATTQIEIEAADSDTPTLIVNTPSTKIQPIDTTTKNTQIGLLASGDLLVLHYDNCPDRDDGHAIPAGKSVVEKFELNNVLIVNGTCGNSIRNSFNSASNRVMKASWGAQYLDAHGQRETAVRESVTRWASTLSNGSHVWIAEGGQSDFTADVVRQIETSYPNINLNNIHVIQHSAGSSAYNERFTDSANLSYLKIKVSYQTIPNGNMGGNGSAGLNQQSFYFVNTARASRFGAEWNAGFEYLPPDCIDRTENCKLDFSDTVGLLYIIDDTDTQNVNDFANKYLH